VVGQPAGDDGVGPGERAEGAGDPDLVVRFEVLAGEEHNLVAQPGGAQGADGGGVEGAAEIDATDLGSDRPGEGPDGDPGRRSRRGVRGGPRGEGGQGGHPAASAGEPNKVDRIGRLF
jgi:hypothetical protein